MAKQSTYDKVAALLVKLQERITNVGLESGQTKAALSTFQDETRLKIGKMQADADRQWQLNASRAKNEVDAMYALRASVQKGFDQVKNDVAELLRLNQRLNERVGKVESQAAILATTANTGSAAFQQMVGVESRVASLEKATGLPTDHVWVNKKLTGVYDSVEELEARLAAAEKIIESYERLRKAQKELATVTNEFYAGK